MDITQISRHLKKSPNESSEPSLHLMISEEEFKSKIAELENFDYRLREITGDEGLVKFISGSYKINDKKIFRYTFIEGQIRISYDGRLTDELINGCKILADSLKAYVLSGVNLEYPKSKIIAAQKRLAKKSKNLEIEYQSESFGGNNMWLSINSNVERVKSFFKLKGEEKKWADALADMYSCKGMFLLEFRGWTFLAGQKVDILFECKGESEKEIEHEHVEKLLEWGRTYNDIQLYMHYNRSNYFNAFYRVVDGDLRYGEYYTESYEKKYGKMSKNLKNLPDNNANTIAMEWSYDPDHLRFHKELKDIKVWVVNIKEK